MEYYILDSSLNENLVVEGFDSFIWTDREAAYGDIEIKIASTPKTRAQFTPGVKLSCAGSDRVMIVDTVTDAKDDTGARMLDITGKSMENLLNDRVAMPALADLTTTPKWVLTDTPGNIMRTIFQTICVDCVLDPNDSIPFYQAGTVTPAGSIPEPTDVVTITLDPGSVYTALQTIANTYSLGFRLVRHKRTSGLPQIYFEVYTGTDRTSDKTVVPAVIFSESLDNLSDKSVLTSTASLKTVAYVFAQNGAQAVYGINADTLASGFGRKVLYVDASDIDTAAGATLTAQLTQKGLEALAAQQTIYTFDGQIPESGGYQYGTDYNMGDIVEEQDETGFGNRMRVTEQIFVSDNTGEKSYPTLTVDIVVVPGTWSAWNATQDWSAVDTTEVWGNV
jgi:hypothetical protein